MTEQKPRIFLCHAKEDKPRVIELYHQLKEAGYSPWLDKHDLLSGQEWWTEIEKIISDPDNLVVVCLSNNSTTKRGVVQEEIAVALDMLKRMPEDTIYLMPARLEPCGVPRRLSRLHYVDLFEEGGFENLRRALDFEIARRQPPRQPFEPELIHIPAGEFLMGSTQEQIEQVIAQGLDRAYAEREAPQHTVSLPDYHIAKTPVTNVQYLAFVEATDQNPPDHWEGGKPPGDKEDHPAVYVSWHDAIAYCQWLAEATGKAYRLPSEAEWEKAAGGTDGRIHPWGDEPPDIERCNFDHNVGDTTPVGQHSPQGDSPYGCVDMAGNVWEWSQSLFKDYPYDPEDGREDLSVAGGRVLRGGSWRSYQRSVRVSCRDDYHPGSFGDLVGFRVCVAAQQE